MESPSVDILVATYNGARFLRPQIESLLAQKDVSFRILVRDDGSSDGTPGVIEHYVRSRPDCFVFFESSENLGTAGNFAYLLARAKAPYVALCDQDDVWVPHKLRTLLDTMRALEARNGAGTPMLVHSDLAVVDEELRKRHASFWRYSGFDPRRTRLPQLLLKNTVTGCASLINRALIELALPVPPAALMHDYWLALVACAAGRLVAVDEPLVFYRQHRHNVIGAQAYSWSSIAERFDQLGKWDIGAQRGQAAALSERCHAAISEESIALISDFVGLPERNWLGRRWLLVRRGILMPGFMRNIALLLCVRLGK